MTTREHRNGRMPATATTLPADGLGGPDAHPTTQDVREARREALMALADYHQEQVEHHARLVSKCLDEYEAPDKETDQ